MRRNPEGTTASSSIDRARDIRTMYVDKSQMVEDKAKWVARKGYLGSASAEVVRVEHM